MFYDILAISKTTRIMKTIIIVIDHMVKNSHANAGDTGGVGSILAWVGKIPWRKKWQPTPVFLPGQFHGQRSLVGCSPWGHRESDLTEHTAQDIQGARLLSLGQNTPHNQMPPEDGLV